MTATVIDLAAARAERSRRVRTVTLHAAPEPLVMLALEPWMLGWDVWRSCARMWLAAGLAALDAGERH